MTLTEGVIKSRFISFWISGGVLLLSSDWLLPLEKSSVSPFPQEVVTRWWCHKRKPLSASEPAGTGCVCVCVCENGGQGKIFRCEKQIRGLNVAQLRLTTGGPAGTCSGSQNLRILVPGPAQGLRNLFQLKKFLKTLNLFFMSYMFAVGWENTEMWQFGSLSNNKKTELVCHLLTASLLMETFCLVVCAASVSTGSQTVEKKTQQQKEKLWGQKLTNIL